MTPIPVTDWAIQRCISRTNRRWCACLVTPSAKTSPIAKIDGRLVTTRSGTVYRLEGPPPFGDWHFTGPTDAPLDVLGKGFDPFYLDGGETWPPGAVVPPVDEDEAPPPRAWTPPHPSLLPEYDAALARGLTEKQARREAFVLTYRITTNDGAFRSREEVIKTVANFLRSAVKRPTEVARRYVDDHNFMHRHVGETAGSIARAVWADVPQSEWRDFTKGVP